MGSHEQLPKNLSLAKLQWMEAWADFCKVELPAPWFKRPLIVSPFYGHHGLAGYALCVEGSPIRSLLLVDVADKQILKAYPRPIGTKWVDHYLAHRAKKPSAISRMYDRTFDLLQAAGLRTDSGGDEGIVPVTVQ
jgi:hypothetical protein